MRKVYGPNGEDNTGAAFAWLKANRQIAALPHLYLIGEIGHPGAIWATDYDRPLTWGSGTFIPQVITRSGVATKISLDVGSIDLTYSPSNLSFTKNSLTTSPLELAHHGYYDNWRVRVWRVIMPTPGDCSTYGAFELFGGRIAGSTVDRLKVVFHCNNWLDLLNQKFPANVIENTNVLASYAGAKPPAGFSNIPRFSVADGSSETTLILDCLNFPSTIFSRNIFAGGWLLFDFPDGNNPSETLGGFWSIVGGNQDYTDGLGHHHNQVQIYTPLPWPPTPYVASPAAGDTCFISAPFPVDQAEGTIGTDNFPFPYVPAPETAV